MFGEGIYFSTELTVAFAFANAGPTWRFSSLGGRQHCLFVCGIDKARARLDGDSQVSRGPWIEVAEPGQRSDLQQARLFREVGDSLGGIDVIEMRGQGRTEARLCCSLQAPDKYLVVDRSDAVTIYYAFMYGEDDAGLQVQDSEHAAAWGDCWCHGCCTVLCRAA